MHTASCVRHFGFFWLRRERVCADAGEFSIPHMTFKFPAGEG